jgi:Lipase (class 3)
MTCVKPQNAVMCPDLLLDIVKLLERPFQSSAGHSLGGALSILAAYDIQTEFALPLRQVQGCRMVFRGRTQFCTWLLAGSQRRHDELAPH